MGVDLHELGHKNPKILLDNGHVIWGCQCWFASEEKIKSMIELYEKGQFEVEIVDPVYWEDAQKVMGMGDAKNGK